MWVPLCVLLHIMCVWMNTIHVHSSPYLIYCDSIRKQRTVYRCLKYLHILASERIRRHLLDPGGSFKYFNMSLSALTWQVKEQVLAALPEELYPHTHTHKKKLELSQTQAFKICRHGERQTEIQTEKSLLRKRNEIIKNSLTMSSFNNDGGWRMGRVL